MKCAWVSIFATILAIASEYNLLLLSLRTRMMMNQIFKKSPHCLLSGYQCWFQKSGSFQRCTMDPRQLWFSRLTWPCQTWQYRTVCWTSVRCYVRGARLSPSNSSTTKRFLFFKRCFLFKHTLFFLLILSFTLLIFELTFWMLFSWVWMRFKTVHFLTMSVESVDVGQLQQRKVLPIL